MKDLDKVGYALIGLAFAAVVVGTNNAVSNFLTSLFSGLSSWVSLALGPVSGSSSSATASAATQNITNNGVTNNAQTAAASQSPNFISFANPLLGLYNQTVTGPNTISGTLANTSTMITGAAATGANPGGSSTS